MLHRATKSCISVLLSVLLLLAALSPYGPFTTEAIGKSKVKTSFKDASGIFSTKRLSTLSVIKGYHVIQGGVSAGNYYYYILQKPGRRSTYSDDWNVLVKVDFRKVGRKGYRFSRVLKEGRGTPSARRLFHGNDMTYCPDFVRRGGKKGALVIATGTRRLVWVDPDTLAVLQSRRLDYYLTGIAYSPARKTFVGCSGENVFFFDQNMNRTAEPYFTRSRCAGYSSFTNQGIACDKNYIYFLQSPRYPSSSLRQLRNNIIRVFDWSGAFVRNLEVRGEAAGLEGEHLFWRGGRLHVGMNYSSPKISDKLRVIRSFKIKNS